MLPYLFKIELPIVGEFILRSFGMMVLLGAVSGLVYLRHAFRKLGVPGEDPVSTAAFRILLCGFIGARTLYLIVHPDAARGILAPIAVWEGGLVSYGGFFGGAFGAWLFARKVRMPLLRLGDAILVALVLGQVFGRIGCLLVGDDHGRPWDGPLAITFPSVGVDPATGLKLGPEGSLFPRQWLDVPVHPSQLYLSAMNLVLFVIGAWLFTRRRFDGQVSAVLMMLYAVGRFAIEGTRGDDQARGVYTVAALDLSTAQWISLAVFAIGMIVYARQRARPEARAGPAAAAAPAAAPADGPADGPPENGAPETT